MPTGEFGEVLGASLGINVDLSASASLGIHVDLLEGLSLSQLLMGQDAHSGKSGVSGGPACLDSVVSRQVATERKEASSVGAAGCEIQHECV